MKRIIYSCLNKKDKIYVETLEMLITENDHYVSNFRIPSLISDDEKDIMQYIISSWESSGFTPDLLLLETAFPKAKGSFAGITELPATSLRVYMFNIIDDRVNRYIHDRMAKLNETVRDKGITSEITDEFDKLQRMSNRNKAKEISLNIDSKAVYDEMKLRPLGMRTGIKAIDEKIGGMNKGTVTTIAGFTSQYKTTFALNIARIGSYYDGYNIAYLSLETPKNDMNWNLLSCHSYEPTLSTFSFVCHDRMRKCELTQAEEDFVFNVVEKDLKGDVVIDSEGNTEKRGRIVFLDESDFDSFSFGEISAVLERVDEELEKDMGRGLDAIIVDYIQLCKFSGSGMTHDANAQINSYVTFFRRLGQNFRKSIDANGNESTKQLIVILLAQINRDNWRRAKNNEGRYDITCLADANELERGSYRVFTTYTSEELKGRKSAQVQILKNRTGQTMYEPSVVYADGEAYVFQDEDGITKTFGGDQTASLETLFDSMDDNSLASFGL